ncbi:ribonuclease H [Senna tora]|uniref:Ribonuclease H n=1 Tax=Senna tora TaxID=362788 RepID=A0A834T076_9FABA|nr:ribonuclease H [Senna tora]
MPTLISPSEHTAPMPESHSTMIPWRVVSHHAVKTTKPIRLVKWEAPVPGTFKINVDGSSRGNPGKSGIGGLIRDSNGAMIAGFSVSIGFSDILYAELFAIKYGLELAWKKGCKKVICESDSRDALQSVEWATDVHIYRSMIKKIRELLGREWEVRLVHTLREGNQCADYLAKMGSKSRDSGYVWHCAAPALSEQLSKDAAGVTYIRK